MARVRFAARAAASLRRLVAFLTAPNPQAAERLLDDVAGAALLLTDHSLASPRLPGRRPQRSLLTRRYRYRLNYEVVKGDVRVLDVLHGSQSGPCAACP